MEYLPFEIDENLKASLTRGRDSFPVVMFERQMNSKRSGPLIRHWHEEFQFVLAQTDGVCFDVCDQKYEMHAGEYLFINARRTHMASSTTKTGGNYLCINIHPDFLAACDSPAYRKYVLPFLNAKQLNAVLLDRSASWHAPIIAMLNRMILFYENKTFGYELHVQALILEIWVQIVSHVQSLWMEEPAVSPQSEERITRLMQYIHQHYSEKILLPDLAAAVQLSQSECCRLVKRLTGVSPMTYLNNYRLYKSAALLQTTDWSITNIAMEVGFGNSSYYTERFKKLINCTPNEFRRRCRDRQD